MRSTSGTRGVRLRPFLRIAVLAFLCNTAAADELDKKDELTRKFFEVYGQVRGEETDFAACEKQLLDLLDDAPTPEDRGRVYAALARIHHGTSSRQSDRLVHWAQKAVSYPLDTETKVGLYLRLSEGHDDRRLAVAACLTGIQYSIDAGIPIHKEHVPVPDVDVSLRVGGGMMVMPEEEEKYRKRRQQFERQIEAANEVEMINRIIDDRNALEQLAVAVVVGRNSRETPLDMNTVRTLLKDYLFNNQITERVLKEMVSRQGAQKGEDEGKTPRSEKSETEKAIDVKAYEGITLVAARDMDHVDSYRSLGIRGGFGQDQPIVDFIARRNYVDMWGKLIEKGDRVVIGSAEVVDSTDTFLNSGTKLILRSAAPKEGLIFFGYGFNQADSHFWAIGMKQFRAAVDGYFTIEGVKE